MKSWKLFVVCCVAALALTLPAGASASDGIVVVKPGQTLSAIAAQHKVSVAQICQWNKLSSPDKIRVGQKLHVRPPDSSATPAPSAPAAPAPSTAKSPAPAKTAAPAAAPGPVAVRAPDNVPEKVKQDLAKTGKVLVDKAAKHITPNIKSKAVAPGSNGGYVARYTEVDVASMYTEIMPSAEPGKYVGSIRYMENQYECPGNSRADALQAECRMVKSRRINELIRYDKGKWQY